MSCRCFIVPPHLLRAMAASEALDEPARKDAVFTLESRDRFINHRVARLSALSEPRGNRNVNLRPNQIVSSQLLRSLAESDEVDEETRACARRDLEHLEQVHARVHAAQAAGTEAQQALGAASTDRKGDDKKPQKTIRAIYDMKKSEDETELPGTVVRKEGQKPVKDKSANEAYDNIGEVLKMYADFFDWHSIDNHNMQVISSVHFGKKYENAFWDPEKMQMVFGDGGEFLNNFTKAIDVIGHELTHAVTEHTSPLNYFGQPGALNEHVSDVFGIMVKQMAQKEKADEADWLIGEDCILPGVKGVALRNMKAPGTAYDDPRFGKDPQPDNFKDFEDTYEDNGGVHMYSGIPNKAFYLCAVEFGGFSWEKAGQIWWKAMNSGRIGPQCKFIEFADVTVDVAHDLYSEADAKIVRKAWNDVGVTRRV